MQKSLRTIHLLHWQLLQKSFIALLNKKNQKNDKTFQNLKQLANILKQLLKFVPLISSNINQDH